MFHRRAFKNPGAASARRPVSFFLAFERGATRLRQWRHPLFRLVVLGLLWFQGAATGAPEPSREVTITNALQLRQVAASDELTSRPVALEGLAVWVGDARDQFILQDDSGMMTISLDLHGHPAVKTGQNVRLRAHCLVGHGQAICDALVDNDGIHGSRERSNRVFLPQGWHPLRLEWFNGEKLSALEVEWMGPELPRQPVADAALQRLPRDPAGGGIRTIPGLSYRCYEGQWSRLPDFSRLPVKKQGVSTNFDIGVRTRMEQVGLVFEGGLNVPRDGVFTFWIKSDDGSKFFIDDPTVQLDILGPAEPPASQVLQIIPGQPVSPEHCFQWAEAEGTVTFVNPLPEATFLELSSPQGRLQLEVAEVPTDSLQRLLGCRIRGIGILQPVWSVVRVNDFSILVPGVRQLSVVEIPHGRQADYPITSITSLPGIARIHQTPFLTRVQGNLVSNSTRFPFAITDQTNRLAVMTRQSLPSLGAAVEALGWLTRSDGNWIMVGTCLRTLALETNTSAALPLITQALQAKNLVRAEANRGFPIKIRGVITARIFRGFAIQDPTWSIFIRLNPGASVRTPKVGECWEITGTTVMDFAPTIQVDKAVYLANGVLPDPVRPAWDELINGSLDTQFIELQGVVTAVETNTVELFTRSGKIRLQLYDLDPQKLPGLEDAVVRLRGVISPERDASQQFVLNDLRLFNSAISVDAPAPARPFAAPLKRVGDLSFFDPHASALQSIHLAGQVVQQRHGEYFLMDESRGLRFLTKTPAELENGDLVEIVGFPDLNGSSPTLRECLVHSTGHTALPVARQLSGNALLDAKYDATVVQIQASLVNASVNSHEQVLELQAGNRGFTARLDKKAGIVAGILPGSTLDLIGVYAGQGGDFAAGRGVDSFDLLLNSPADIHVLARPSWWTVAHTLTVLGSLVLVILVTSGWIVVLRRQVEERTRRLAAEIHHREQIEHQRALEAERSRIAQDLHDDLGATLTQIRFLSAVESTDATVPKPTRDRFRQMSEKSLQMVASLDEIVWAVNPANDSVRSLAAYLQHMAAEFFRSTSVNCRFDVDRALSVQPLTSEVRHNLYLATREALNNVAKHSHATELWLRIHWREKKLSIVVEDNGCGFAPPPSEGDRNGLANMRRRIEKIGGSFECDTRRNSGTIYRIKLSFE